MKDLLKKFGPGDIMFSVGFGCLLVSMFTSAAFLVVGLIWMLMGERARTNAILKRLGPEVKEEDPHA